MPGRLYVLATFLLFALATVSVILHLIDSFLSIQPVLLIGLNTSSSSYTRVSAAEEYIFVVSGYANSYTHFQCISDTHGTLCSLLGDILLVNLQTISSVSDSSFPIDSPMLSHMEFQETRYRCSCPRSGGCHCYLDDIYNPSKRL
jgi:hypothetical protein